MKFELVVDSELGATTITAEPGEYDGEPLVREVVFHYAPQQFSDDCKAVLCYLLFQKYISDEMVVPTECSTYLAGALQNLHGRSLRVWPTTTNAKPIQRDGRDGLVLDGSIGSTLLDRLLPESVVRVETSSDGSVGSFVSKQHMLFHSNISVLIESNSLSHIANQLACGILVAEDASLESLCLPITRFGYDYLAGLRVLDFFRDLFTCVDLRLDMPLAILSDEACLHLDPLLRLHQLARCPEEAKWLSGPDVGSDEKAELLKLGKTNDSALLLSGRTYTSELYKLVENNLDPAFRNVHGLSQKPVEIGALK